MPSPHFRYPIGNFERRCRRLADGLMRHLGRPLHVVRAQGGRFLVDSSDWVDRSIAWDGIWEGEQLMIVARVCATRRFDCLLDVGANTGFYSVMFAIKNLAERIIAFEPDPGNHARLLTNLRFNNLAGRVEVHQVALGDRNGEVTLYEGARYNRGESSIAVPDQTPQEVTHLVKVVRFDDEFAIAGQRVFFKIDVEGYEFETVGGMVRTLRDNAGYVQIELYSERLEELKQAFVGLGYRYVRSFGLDHYFTNMPDIR